MTSNPFTEHLNKNPANYVPLSPDNLSRTRSDHPSQPHRMDPRIGSQDLSGILQPLLPVGLSAD